MLKLLNQDLCPYSDSLVSRTFGLQGSFVMKTDKKLKNRFKDLIGGALVVSLMGCSGSPSISVLPSEDTFEQQGNEITAKMDILWVIDNSGSMQNEQTDLRNNFDSFITSFVGKGYDYRMAVVTTDAWYTVAGDYVNPTYDMTTPQTGAYSNFVFNTFNNTIKCPAGATVTSDFVDGDLTAVTQSGYVLIDSTDASIDFNLYGIGAPEYTPGDPAYIGNNVRNIFAINSKVGLTGCYFESGIKSAIASLQSPANAGFPRADAHLAIILVSDEDDFKLGTKETITASTYHDTLTNIASDAFGYSFHSITILEEGADNYCGTGSAYRIGSKYIELSDLSGGITASICGDFAVALDNIAQKIIETTVEFSLSSVPADPNKLVVSVKNPGDSGFTPIPQNIDNGWTYNATANSIVFHGTGIPAQGSEISIFYDPDSL